MTALEGALLGYLLGSIPFGLVLARIFHLGDLRAIGSGNIGATNVLRTGNKGVAAATLLLDGGKGTLAVLLPLWLGLGPLASLAAGAAAVLGHCTSPWAGFRGGKGVATGLGVFLGWSWPVGVACLLIWLLTALLTRRSSAAGLASFVAGPLLLAALAPAAMALAATLVSLLVILRHRGNIQRLLAGTEPRIGAGR